jgi:hypothetical protein
MDALGHPSPPSPRAGRPTPQRPKPNWCRHRWTYGVKGTARQEVADELGVYRRCARCARYQVWTAGTWV